MGQQEADKTYTKTGTDELPRLGIVQKTTTFPSKHSSSYQLQLISTNLPDSISFSFLSDGILPKQLIQKQAIKPHLLTEKQMRSMMKRRKMIPIAAANIILGLVIPSDTISGLSGIQLFSLFLTLKYHK